MNELRTAPALDTGHIVALGILVAILVATVFTELRDQRIPNGVTITGLLAGLLLGYLPGGISLGASIGGFLLGFGFFFLFYLFGGMGGGDVKLMGAAGALLGYPLILPTLVYTALVGGLLACMVLIWRGRFWRGLAYALAMFVRWRRRPAPGETEAPAGAETEGEAPPALGTVPYGLAIVSGCLMTIFFSGRY
jgi:prepilin peptidase CpaA